MAVCAGNNRHRTRTSSNQLQRSATLVPFGGVVMYRRCATTMCVGASVSTNESNSLLSAARRVPCVVALMCAGWVFQPAPLNAQVVAPDAESQARDVEARRLFEAGRSAYVEQKYQDALNYFQEAHALSERPQLLFNVGQAADRLGQREAAAQAFRDYLAAVPDAHNRAEVEARIAELEAPENVEGGGEVSASALAAGSGRDGLYLRGALGLGVFSDDFSRNLGELKATASGASLASEVAVGVALKPGLALAGFVAVEWTQAREIKVGDIAFADQSVGLLFMLGGMVDWYFNPLQGWHVQGGLALSRLSVQGGEGGVVDHSPVGGALLLGGGHEWRVQDKVSMGVLGRITASQLKGDEFTHNLFALSVLFSVTMF